MDVNTYFKFKHHSAAFVIAVLGVSIWLEPNSFTHKTITNHFPAAIFSALSVVSALWIYIRIRQNERVNPIALFPLSLYLILGIVDIVITPTLPLAIAAIYIYTLTDYYYTFSFYRVSHGS